MKMLFISMLPYYPDMAGGAHLTHQSLIELLLQRDWQIQIMSGISRRNPHFKSLKRNRWRALARGKKPPDYVLDESLGYRCWRGIRSRHPLQSYLYKASLVLGRRPSMTGIFRNCVPVGRNVFTPAELRGTRIKLDEILDDFHPDVLLGNYGVASLLDHAAKRGFLCIYYVHGVGRRESSAYAFPDHVHIIANSPHTASVVSRINKAEVEVILPPVIHDRYRSERNLSAPRGQGYITFINPLPQKGVNTAIEVARRLPDERFLFVGGGWFETSWWDIFRSVDRVISRMPNIEVWEFQEDMRRVYGLTDILLVPSERETFGRVILEAQINGIPVVASRTGGIPYTLGRGGIIVDPQAGPEGYLKAINRLRNDDGYNAELSALALENSQRPEFDPQVQTENFIRFVETCSGKSAAVPEPQ